MTVEELVQKLEALPYMDEAVVLADPQGAGAVHVTDVEVEDGRVYIIIT